MPPFNKLRNDTGVLLKATPPEIQRLAEVGSVNLYVVNPVVVVDGFAVQSLDSNVDSLVRLTDMVVQDSTGHGAVLDHFLALFQSVNAEQVDVFANRTACSGDCSSCAERHAVVVAEDHVDLVAMSGQSVCSNLLTLVSCPVADLVVEALNSDACIFQSLDGELGTILCVDVLGVAFDHNVGDNAVAVCVALVRQSRDDFALIRTGLTSVSTDVADTGVVEDAFVSLVQKQLIDKLWESYELTPSSAKEQTVEVESIAAANRRIGEVKRKMSSLGTPNLGAIDEYARVSERYEYLCSQRDDVLHAKGELETIVGDITREMTEIFAREFARINEYFGATFTEMFGGGKASLELEDEKEPLSCGIEIKVQPPGKQLKTITLLSGGEKAFVAIALYFAILKVRPTPFCMLDEIDAALDDRNVERFAAYLHKFSGKTQFIVITHRRGTMEAADVLYGVTMQEQGISKILHLDLDELQKQLGITA